MASEIPKAQVIDYIIELFVKRGQANYSGEPVSQTEHALQAAWAAEKQNASAAMIASALLHDLGHLLHDFGEDCADAGIDDLHEERAAAWLADYFGPDVTEPIRLHVAAKRYRCATEPHYFRALSPASVQSLALQGGPFTPDEVDAFQRLEHSQQALRLRLWDEIAKVENLATPDLEHFRPYLTAALRAD
ncbi:MAG: phosphonate degradation HD-domain oxygenase [Planctomycetaceae bacterium]